MSGYSPEELKASKGFNIVHPDDVTESRKFYQEMLANPGVPIYRKTRLVHKSGKIVWIEGYNTNLLNDPGIKAVVSNFHDITERIIAEEKIKKSEKLFRSIVQNIPKSLVIVMDKEHKLIMLEGDIMESLGFKKQDYEGKALKEVTPAENYERSKPLYDRVFKGEHFSVERNSEAGDYIVHFVPMEEDNGSVETALIIALDITEIKKAQREVAELNRDLEKKVEERTEQLTSVNKELESFSYSVSHDLRAPLRAINGYAKMIEEDYGVKFDEEGKRLLSNVQDNAQRMGNLIDDLLAFSRLGRKDLQKTDVNFKELAISTITELEKTVQHHAKIEVGELDDAKADYALISQVFYNLLSNAVKYSSKKENPVVSITSKKTNDEVIYCFKDNGAGFDMKYANKLFGIFQRLHSLDEFEGTGVGLAIVQRIVIKHGGKIWAEAEPEKGASFLFSLPLNK
jgi:PAS domain S-box-containing protein